MTDTTDTARMNRMAQAIHLIDHPKSQDGSVAWEDLLPAQRTRYLNYAAAAYAVDDSNHAREGMREAVLEAIDAEMGCVYDCTRDWSAWSVGTMSINDFQPVRDRIEEITDGIMCAVGAYEDSALREDAERWRAFIGSDRFYVMGYAGFTHDRINPQVDPNRDKSNWLHFTLNVWDRHPAGQDEQGTHGRALLLAYVDHLRQNPANAS